MDETDNNNMQESDEIDYFDLNCPRCKSELIASESASPDYNAEKLTCPKCGIFRVFII